MERVAQSKPFQGSWAEETSEYEAGSSAQEMETYIESKYVQDVYVNWLPYFLDRQRLIGSALPKRYLNGSSRPDR
ncbi:unnamed protein product [Fusarium venenatum]|uniref:Uncharacterized protein n=1 Tax=Fusarium venenatum TaxID=56646 RepID=A0A2L2SWL2_9HYPO|nr:uncharacterized protein FVRRES_12986 [Fusarium venenatum]CEI40295.1 unnamed protein product [Fusarium venenatum]